MRKRKAGFTGKMLKSYYEREAQKISECGGQYFDPDRGLNFYFRCRYNATIGVFPHGSNAKFLDVGSGTGVYSVHMLKEGYEGVLLDFSRSYLKLAENLILQEGVDERNGVVERDAMCMPFNDDSFDVVMLLEVIEHIPEYRNVLLEARRVLRPNRALIISVPLKYSYKEFKDRIKLRALRLISRLVATMRRKEPPHRFLQHLHFFTYSDILKVLSEFGFEVEERAFSCYFFLLFKSLLGTSHKAQSTYLWLSKLLSRTPFRCFAWNVVMRCKRRENI